MQRGSRRPVAVIDNAGLHKLTFEGTACRACFRIDKLRLALPLQQPVILLCLLLFLLYI
jgi:hypothetical protein